MDEEKYLVSVLASIKHNFKITISMTEPLKTAYTRFILDSLSDN